MYSQLGQDYFVLEVLAGMTNGFFLDSGACDGLRASNTYLLEAEYGWKGICVEPNKQFYEELIRNRTCHCVNCCLYGHEGTVNFLEANTLGGIVEEFQPGHLEYATRTFGIIPDEHGNYSTVQKEARTIESVLDEFHAPPVIDYWSLDTEGSELAILKSFPFNKYSFKVLTVEHNHHLPIRDAIRRLMYGNRYVLIREMGIDDCFIREDVLQGAVRRKWNWRRVRRGGL